MDLAQRFRSGYQPAAKSFGTLGLIFYEVSLRTRIGFTVAAHRLGMRTVNIDEQKRSSTQVAEHWADTVRVISGYCSVVVGRVGLPLSKAVIHKACICPFINGGDRGDQAEHPTQALIDLFAMRMLCNTLPKTVVIWGDSTSRVARSLIRLLALHADVSVFIVSLSDSDQGTTSYTNDSKITPYTIIVTSLKPAFPENFTTSKSPFPYICARMKSAFPENVAPLNLISSKNFTSLKSAFLANSTASKSVLPENFTSLKSTLLENFAPLNKALALEPNFTLLKLAYLRNVAPLKSRSPENIAPLKSAFSENVAPLKSTSPENIAPLKSAFSENVAPLKATLAEKFTLVKNAVTTD